MPPEHTDRAGQEGAVLAYVLCVGALLVVGSALVLGAAGQLVHHSDRLAEEEAWQQAITLADQLEGGLCGSQTDLHRFIGEVFLSDAYEDDTWYTFTASDLGAGYGTASVSLQRSRVQSRAEAASWYPDEMPAEALLSVCEAYEAQAPAVWQLTMSVEVLTTAQAQCERVYRWTEAGEVLYSTADGQTFRRDPGTLQFSAVLPATAENAVGAAQGFEALSGPVTMAWQAGTAAEASCTPQTTWKEEREDAASDLAG